MVESQRLTLTVTPLTSTLDPPLLDQPTMLKFIADDILKPIKRIIKSKVLVLKPYSDKLILGKVSGLE